MNQDKLISIAKEIGFDVSVGISGYFAAIQFNWIEEAHHILTALFTAIVCCAGVHYFKKLLKWIDGPFISWLKTKFKQ